jgi:hypothetical protein
MQRIPAAERRVAMLVRPSVKNAPITLAHVMTTSATEPKRRAHHVLLEIAHKVTAHHFKIEDRVRRVIVRLIKTEVRAHREIVRKANAHPIKIAARALPAHPMPTRQNSVAGMYPMVSIQAHA